MHVGRELDPLRVGEAEHLVVVQHRIHVLDPHGVHGPVAYQPLVVWLFALPIINIFTKYLSDFPFAKTKGTRKRAPVRGIRKIPTAVQLKTC